MLIARTAGAKGRGLACNIARRDARLTKGETCGYAMTSASKDDDVQTWGDSVVGETSAYAHEANPLPPPMFDNRISLTSSQRHYNLSATGPI